MTEIQSKLLTKHLNISDEDCLKINIALKNKDALTIEGNTCNTDLSTASVVNIDGIMLPVYDKTNVQSGILVPVTSTVNNLRSLALAVASGK